MIINHGRFTDLKISVLPEPVFKTWDSKCLDLTTQMDKALGMNPKVRGSNPPQVKTLSASKTLTLSQEISFVCRKSMSAAHS